MVGISSGLSPTFDVLEMKQPIYWLRLERHTQVHFVCFEGIFYGFSEFFFIDSIFSKKKKASHVIEYCCVAQLINEKMVDHIWATTQIKRTAKVKPQFIVV